MDDAEVSPFVFDLDRQRRRFLLPVEHFFKACFETSQFFLVGFLTQLGQPVLDFLQRFLHFLFSLLLLFLGSLGIVVVHFVSGLILRLLRFTHLLLTGSL